MKTIRFSKLFFLAMITPALLIYTIFFIIPSFLTLILSFVRWSGFNSNWFYVGFENYKQSFSDPVFLLSLRNTLYIIFIGGISIFIISLFFSLILSETKKSHFKELSKAIIFMPFVISIFATISMWQNIYNPTTGIISILEKIFDIQTNFMFTEPENILNSMIIAIIWQSTGFYLIILLSGIDKIPKEMFESAEIDGASIWRKFFNITLPLIWDVVIICFTLWIILAIKNFEFPYAFGAQNIPQNLYNTSVYMYIKGFGQREAIFQMGYASAIGIQSIAIAGVLVYLTRKLFKKDISEL